MALSEQAAEEAEALAAIYGDDCVEVSASSVLVALREEGCALRFSLPPAYPEDSSGVAVEVAIRGNAALAARLAAGLADTVSRTEPGCVLLFGYVEWVREQLGAQEREHEPEQPAAGVGVAQPPRCDAQPLSVRASGDGGCTISVHAKPGSRKGRVVAVTDDAVELAIDAPAREGEANEAGGELLAEALGVKRRDVTIVSGHKSRDKVFAVATLGPAEAARLLRAAAAGDSAAQPVRITHGPALTERRSTFQAHVCAIDQPADVKAFMAQVLENRRVADATHNILAWRIETRPGQWSSDCDDDGESAAGGRLLHLLTLLRVRNVAVCVSRWYGGILLGAERFKLINAAARAALEAGGHMPA